MALAIGGNSVSKAYLGSTEIQKMYLGSNLVFSNGLEIPTGIKLTEVGSVLTPIMTRFRVENGNLSRIYFDTPLGSVTGLTPQGFVIADSAGLVGHTVQSVNTTENYLELDTLFDYWDNPLISLVGGDGTVYDFTLQSVDNQTAENNSLSARYISADGTGGGLTEGDPMSFASAAAETNRAGRIYWVKKGNYTGLNGIEWNSGGTHTDPVKIVGYDTVIGDHPVLDWSTSNPDFDANVMPLIDGGDLYSTPFNFRADYFIIKNIQIQNYTQDNFYFSNGAGFIDIDNCYSHNSTNGFMFISSSTENNRITNSIIYGADTHGIQMGTTDGIAYTAWANKGRCLIDNVKVYSASTIDNGLDYFIKVNNCDNTIKNCHVEKLTPTSHVGSGIDLKADEVITERNLIENCTGTTVKAVINLRHELCSNNVVRNVTANKVAADQSGCISITAGSSYNTLENITAIGVDEFVRWYDITETVGNVGMGSYNKFINCVADNVGDIIYSGRFTGSDNPTGPATNNEFLNCTWTNCTNLFGAFMFTFDNTNKFTNNIFDTVANLVNGSATGTQAFVFDYNLFYSPTNTDWSYTGDGANKITLIDPVLNASYQPQATFADIDVPKIATINYDKDGNERQDPTTVGGVLSAEEVPGVVVPDYYVALSGDNTDGLTEATAFNTISRVNTEINNDTFIGKTVAFKRGDTFNGQILFDSDSGTLGNEIMFTAYGTGNLPIINTVMPYTDGTWVEGDANIWRNTSISYDPNRIIVDNGEILQGISYAALGTNVPDLTRWWRGDNGDGGTYVYLYSTTDPNLSDIEISNETYTVRFKNSSYAKIDSLYLKGGSAATISLSGATNITFTNCDVGDMSRIGSQCEENAVEGANIVVDNCRFDSKYTLDFSGAGTSDGTSNLGTDDGFSASSLKVGEIKNTTFINWGHSSINLVTNSGGTSEVDNVIMHGNTFTTPDLSYGGGLTLDRLTNNCEAYDNNFIGTKDSQINGNNNYIHDNNFDGCKDSPFQNYITGYAIKVQNYAGNSHDNRIEGNTMIDCDGAGIAISGNNNSGDLYGNIFDGNDIQNCGLGSYSSNQGIQFDNNSSGSNDGNTFTNNNIYSPATSDTILYYGSYISVAQFNVNNGDSHGHTITGNTNNL